MACQTQHKLQLYYAYGRTAYHVVIHPRYKIDINLHGRTAYP